MNRCMKMRSCSKEELPYRMIERKRSTRTKGIVNGTIFILVPKMQTEIPEKIPLTNIIQRINMMMLRNSVTERWASYHSIRTIQ